MGQSHLKDLEFVSLALHVKLDVETFDRACAIHPAEDIERVADGETCGVLSRDVELRHPLPDISLHVVFLAHFETLASPIDTTESVDEAFSELSVGL